MNASLTGTVQVKRVGKAGNIALFTLDRPHKANAYNDAIIDTFCQELRSMTADPTIAVGIVTGAGGKAFCAGADKTGLSERSYLDGLHLRSRALFQAWADAPWPTIAAIQAPAIGGGLELALASDLRLCAPASWFALPEIDLGLIPAAGGIARLTEIIGVARAKAMVLFGTKIDSATALQWGLVTQIDDEVFPAAMQLAEIVAQRDILATRLAKTTFQSMAKNTATECVEAVSQALLYHRKNTRHQQAK